MPIMPFIHDALYIGGFVGLVLVARQALARYNLRLSGLPSFDRLRRSFGDGFTCRERPRFASARASGNTDFDAWRDAEISRIDAQRRALEVRQQDFEGFLDKLKCAQDRVTFDRFMAEHPRASEVVVDMVGSTDPIEHRPN